MAPTERKVSNSRFHPFRWLRQEIVEQFTAFENLFDDALGRVVIFLFFAMPFVFLIMMCAGGYLLKFMAGWPFESGFELTVSAATGGAIDFQGLQPRTFHSKLGASLIASFGNGIWGFMVAVLSNSLVAPLVSALGIEVKQSEIDRETTKTVLRSLGCLAMSIVVANLVAALFFGVLLNLMEGWSFWTGVKTMASVVLGGGIQFDDMGVVNNFQGRLVYTIVGVWSYGICSLMVAVAAEPGHKVVSAELGIKEDDEDTPCHSCQTLCLLVLFVLPVSLFLVMLSIAAVMAPMTNWNFYGAFWTALPAVSGGAAEIWSGTTPPLQLQGEILLTVAASLGFFCMSLMIGVGGELIDPILNGRLLSETLGTQRKVRHSVLALFCISAFLIPAAVAVGALFVGGFISLVEEWPFADGFWWCVSVQLGGGMELTEREIDTVFCSMLAMLAVAWSIGISILTVGVSSAPVVEPLIDYLGMTIPVEELESLGISCKATRKKERSVSRASVSQGSYGTEA